MKKLIGLMSLVFVLTLTSCTKENRSDINAGSAGDVYNPQREFAVILSKAVTDSKELRAFIKEEALKEFDKDYDVFYPFVKDKSVSGSCTFRDVLLNYCEYDGQLEKIENSLPLLTILLPDISWIHSDLFSPVDWDINKSSVMVTYSDGNKNREMIENGETSFFLEPDEIPEGSILIVKDNERLVVKSRTRVPDVNEIEYEFIDEVFDNTKPKTKKNDYKYTTENYAVEDCSAFVTTAKLQSYSPKAVQAYEEFAGSNLGAALRDYCYYGMTKSNTTKGKLNVNMMEGLFRMRFSRTEDFAYLCDDPARGEIFTDPSYSEWIQFESNRNGASAPLFGLMCEGRLEFRIDYYFGNTSGGTTSSYVTVTASAADMLQVKSAQIGYKNKTMFNHKKWIYKPTFVPKWYYPKDPYYFLNWDLSSKSTLLALNFKEVDKGATVSREDSQTWEFSNTINEKYKDEKNELGVGTTLKYSETSKYTLTYTDKDDMLGWAYVRYDSDYIKNKTDDGYILREYSCGGGLIISVVPYEN